MGDEQSFSEVQDVQTCPRCGTVTRATVVARVLADDGQWRTERRTDTVPHPRSQCAHAAALEREQWPASAWHERPVPVAPPAQDVPLPLAW